MLTLIQIIAVIYVLFTASRAILRAKDKKISVFELFFWLAIWFGLVFVVFFPNIVSNIADLLGIGRGIDFILYVSVGVLFYLIFRLYVKIEESQQQITHLVREISLWRKKTKKK